MIGQIQFHPPQNSPKIDFTEDPINPEEVSKVKSISGSFAVKFIAHFLKKKETWQLKRKWWIKVV